MTSRSEKDSVGIYLLSYTLLQAGRARLELLLVAREGPQRVSVPCLETKVHEVRLWSEDLSRTLECSIYVHPVSPLIGRDYSSDQVIEGDSPLRPSDKSPASFADGWDKLTESYESFITETKIDQARRDSDIKVEDKEEEKQNTESDRFRSVAKLSVNTDKHIPGLTDFEGRCGVRDGTPEDKAGDEMLLRTPPRPESITTKPAVRGFHPPAYRVLPTAGKLEAKQESFTSASECLSPLFARKNRAERLETVTVDWTCNGEAVILELVTAGIHHSFDHSVVSRGSGLMLDASVRISNPSLGCGFDGAGFQPHPRHGQFELVFPAVTGLPLLSTSETTLTCGGGSSSSGSGSGSTLSSTTGPIAPARWVGSVVVRQLGAMAKSGPTESTTHVPLARISLRSVNPASYAPSVRTPSKSSQTLDMMLVEVAELGWAQHVSDYLATASTSTLGLSTTGKWVDISANLKGYLDIRQISETKDPTSRMVSGFLRYAPTTNPESHYRVFHLQGHVDFPTSLHIRVQPHLAPDDLRDAVENAWKNIAIRSKSHMCLSSSHSSLPIRKEEKSKEGKEEKKRKDAKEEETRESILVSRPLPVTASLEYMNVLECASMFHVGPPPPLPSHLPSTPPTEKKEAHTNYSLIAAMRYEVYNPTGEPRACILEFPLASVSASATAAWSGTSATAAWSGILYSIPSSVACMGNEFGNIRGLAWQICVPSHTRVTDVLLIYTGTAIPATTPASIPTTVPTTAVTIVHSPSLSPRPSSGGGIDAQSDKDRPVLCSSPPLSVVQPQRAPSGRDLEERGGKDELVFSSSPFFSSDYSTTQQNMDTNVTPSTDRSAPSVSGSKPRCILL